MAYTLVMVPDAGTQEREYRRSGWIHLRGVLSSEYVASLRVKLDELFSGTGQKRFLKPTEIYAVPELYRLPFVDPVVSALKSLLEESYTQIPNLLVQRNMEGPWHQDACQPSRELLDDDYRFVKCGLFLQDNTWDWGGGVDVVPGSHRYPLVSCHPRWRRFLRRKRVEFGQVLLKRSLEVRAGDFIAFDSRLAHRSTPSCAPGLKERKVNNFVPLPPERTKYVFYWDSCRTRYAAAFLNNAQRRAEMEEFQNNPNQEYFFSDYLRLRYPDDYPREFVDALERHRIRPGLLDPSQAQSVRLKYEQRYPPS